MYLIDHLGHLFRPRRPATSPARISSDRLYRPLRARSPATRSLLHPTAGTCRRSVHVLHPWTGAGRARAGQHRRGRAPPLRHRLGGAPRGPRGRAPGGERSSEPLAAAALAAERPGDLPRCLRRPPRRWLAARRPRGAVALPWTTVRAATRRERPAEPSVTDTRSPAAESVTGPTVGLAPVGRSVRSLCACRFECCERPT